MSHSIQKTRRVHRSRRSAVSAVAVFQHPRIQGHVVATPCSDGGINLVATFHKLPTGLHGFHIHKAGDLRQKDCKGLCEHYDQGRHRHGAGPGTSGKGDRHTGDLGNVRGKRKTVRRRYCLPTVSVEDLWGRSIIVHEDKDDLGLGSHVDSGTTGHSGKRMAAAIFGRAFNEC